VESSWVHSAPRPPMAYCAKPRWLWWRRNWQNDVWQGKLKYSEKTCPSAASSTTNPTCWPDVNTGRHGEKPATNRLSYGTAVISSMLQAMHVQHNCWHISSSSWAVAVDSLSLHKLYLTSLSCMHVHTSVFSFNSFSDSMSDRLKSPAMQVSPL
jgi:hypothetical protein